MDFRVIVSGSILAKSDPFANELATNNIALRGSRACDRDDQIISTQQLQCGMISEISPMFVFEVGSFHIPYKIFFYTTYLITEANSSFLW